MRIQKRQRERRRESARLAFSGQNVQGTYVSVQEIEPAVGSLSPGALAAFAQWFKKFLADEWDKQIEAHALSGNLDHLARRADEHFDAGRCAPL
jgi:hypothetical protein